MIMGQGKRQKLSAAEWDATASRGIICWARNELRHIKTGMNRRLRRKGKKEAREINPE